MLSLANLTQLLSNSIVVMVFGSNDNINNYLLPKLYRSSRTYNPEEFADLLLNHYRRQLLALYNAGLRKFFLAGMGPLGCIPNHPKILSANHIVAGVTGLRVVATSQRGSRGSGSVIKRTRAYIPCEREEAEQRLLDDYFGDDETPPKYPEENFRRRYRMSSTLCAQIVNDITSYDAQPLSGYFRFFRKGYDAIGRASITPILKCTSAIHQLAYDTTPDAFDEYLQIAERCSRECLDNFTKCMYILYV
nr:GDSL esterase/lipase At1g71250 [Tanacetum cinerariifolium]